MEFLTEFKRSIDAVPMWNWALQGIGLITAYVGADLNSRLRISGFYVWLASNITLAVLHAATGLWLLFLLDIMFFRLNVRGVLTWSREKPEQVPKFLAKWLLPKGPSSTTES